MTNAGSFDPGAPGVGSGDGGVWGAPTSIGGGGGGLAGTIIGAVGGVASLLIQKNEREKANKQTQAIQLSIIEAEKNAQIEILKAQGELLKKSQTVSTNVGASGFLSKLSSSTSSNSSGRSLPSYSGASSSKSSANADIVVLKYWWVFIIALLYAFKKRGTNRKSTT